MAIGFKKLKLTRQHRNVPKKKLLSAIGCDTETHTSVNRVELIATEDGSYLNPLSEEALLHFFFKDQFRGKVFVFYNLRFDVQAVLKWFDPSIWFDLWDTGKATYQDYTFTLIPWKWFKITRNKMSVSMYDISQFYNYASLDHASKKYLGIGKIDFDRANIEDFKHPDTIKYCVHDAMLCGELTRHLLNVHTEHFPDSNASLISKAAMAEKHFSATCSLPTINNLITNYPAFIKIAYLCYKGGFFSAFKRGYFPKLYVYDINSAYPYHMAQLPDLSRGGFCKFIKAPPHGEYLGWYQVRVNICDSAAYFSPLAVRFKGISMYPEGYFRAYITKLEYDELIKHFDIEIINGVSWIPSDIIFPWKAEIERLYEWKKFETDPILKSLVKIILNSIYGKTIQKVPLIDDPSYSHKTGNLFNPFYASYITAGTRIQIFKEVAKMDASTLVMIATDSIMTTRPIDVPLTKDLGDWGIEKHGQGVVMGSGVYSIKDENSTITKRRGFKTNMAQSFFDVNNIPQEQQKLLLSVKRHISMAQALIQHRPEDMNLILTEQKKLDINFDRKRIWHQSFKQCKDILHTQIDSSPIHIDTLTLF